MNSQLGTYIVTAVLLGTLGGTYYYLFDQSIVTWYGILLTQWKSDYLTFYNQLGLVAFFFGILLNIDSLKHRFWIVSTLLIFLFNLLMLLTGLLFTTEIKTVQYVLYFTEIQTAWIAYFIYSGMFLRHLLESKISVEHKNLIITSIPLIGLVIYVLFETLSRLIMNEISYFISLTVLLAGILFSFSRRTSKL